MSAFARLAEERIAAALPEWEAALVPLHGKALDLDGYFAMPAAVRAGHQLLKDAGVVPPEVELLRAIAGRREALAGLTDPGELAAGRAALALLETELALRMERRRLLLRTDGGI